MEQVQAILDQYGLNVVDVAAVALLAWGALTGLIRGLSGEIARIISLVLACVGGLFAYQPLTHKVMEYTRIPEQWAQPAAFIAVFILVWFFIKIFRILIGGLLELATDEKSLFQRITGMGAGFARMFILVGAVFFFMTIIPNERMNQLFGVESRVGQVYQKCRPYYDSLAEKVPGLPALPESRVTGGATSEPPMVEE